MVAGKTEWHHLLLACKREHSSILFVWASKKYSERECKCLWWQDINFYGSSSSAMSEEEWQRGESLLLKVWVDCSNKRFWKQVSELRCLVGQGWLHHRISPQRDQWATQYQLWITFLAWLFAEWIFSKMTFGYKLAKQKKKRIWPTNLQRGTLGNQLLYLNWYKPHLIWVAGS